ncbi:hypothetical protein TUN199_08270, partial [Pyrenophora tritici-repentis]
LYASAEDPASTTTFTDFFTKAEMSTSKSSWLDSYRLQITDHSLGRATVHEPLYYGKLIVVENVASNPKDIIALKQELLPTAGTKHWNHLPNVTTVSSETSAQKTYEVLGIIESRFDGGNCSQAYYSSRFTVTKNTAGSPNLTPHSGSLVAYDDFVVSPMHSPTDIACET